MKTLLFITTLVASATAIHALPVQIDAGSQARLCAHTAMRHGKLTVTGTVSGLRHAASHVEVDLVNARGQTIASAVDKIGKPSRHPRTTGHDRERFIASFPGSVARQAAVVRVVFHNHSHSSCGRGC